MVLGAQDILESPDEPEPVSADDSGPVVVQEGVISGPGVGDEDRGDRDSEAVVEDADEKEIATRSGLEDVSHPVIEDSNDFCGPPSSPIVLQPVDEDQAILSSEQQLEPSTETTQIPQDGDTESSQILEQHTEPPPVPQVECGTLEESSTTQPEKGPNDDALPEQLIPEDETPDGAQQQRPLTPDIIEDSQFESSVESPPSSTENQLPESLLVAPSVSDRNLEHPEKVDELIVDSSDAEQPDVEQPDVEQPSVEETGVEQPNIEQPSIEEPSIEETGVKQPGVEEPGVEQPTTEESSAEQPTAVSPILVPSTADQPSPALGIDSPSSEDALNDQEEQGNEPVLAELPKEQESSHSLEPSTVDRAGPESGFPVDETTLEKSLSSEQLKEDDGEPRSEQLDNVENLQVIDSVDSEQADDSEVVQRGLSLGQGGQEDAVSHTQPLESNLVTESAQSSSESVNITPDPPLDQVQNEPAALPSSTQSGADPSNDTERTIKPAVDAPSDTVDAQNDSLQVESAQALSEMSGSSTIDISDELDRDLLGGEFSQIEQDAPGPSLESSEVLPTDEQPPAVTDPVDSSDDQVLDGLEASRQGEIDDTNDAPVVSSKPSLEELPPSTTEEAPSGDPLQPQLETAVNEEVALDQIVVDDQAADVEGTSPPGSPTPNLESQESNADLDQGQGQDEGSQDIQEAIHNADQAVPHTDDLGDNSQPKSDLVTSSLLEEEEPVVPSQEQGQDISGGIETDTQPGASSQEMVDQSSSEPEAVIEPEAVEPEAFVEPESVIEPEAVEPESVIESEAVEPEAVAEPEAVEPEAVIEPDLHISSSGHNSGHTTPKQLPVSSEVEESSHGLEESSHDLEGQEAHSSSTDQPGDQVELVKGPGSIVDPDGPQQDENAAHEQSVPEPAVESHDDDLSRDQIVSEEAGSDDHGPKEEDSTQEVATQELASQDVDQPSQMPLESSLDPIIDGKPSTESLSHQPAEQTSGDNDDIKNAGIAAATAAAPAAAAAAGIAVHELVSSKDDVGDEQIAVSGSTDDVQRPRTADKATGTLEESAPDQNDLEVHSISSAAPDSPEEVSSQQPLSESFTIVDPPSTSEQEQTILDSSEKPVLLSRVDSSTQTDELWRPKTPLPRGSTPGIVLPDPNDEEVIGRSRARSARRMSRQSVQQAEEVVAAAVIIRAAADTLGETSDRMADHVKDLKQHGETTARSSLQVDGRGTRVADTSIPYDFIADPTTGKESSKTDDKLPRSPRSREHRASHSSRSSRPSTREDGTTRSSHHRHSSHRHRADGERESEQVPRTPPRHQDTGESAHGSHSSRSRRERTPQEQAEHERRKEERRLAREKDKAKTDSPVAEPKGKEVEAPPSADRSHRSSRRHSSTRHSVASPSNTARTEASTVAPSKKFFDMKNGQSVMGSSFGGPLTADTASTATKDKDTISSSRRSKEVTRPPPVELKRSSTTRSSKGVRRSLDQSNAKLQKAREQESTKAAKESKPRRDDSSSPSPADANKAKDDDKHRKSRLEKREKEDKDEKKKSSGGLKGMFKRLFSN